MRFGRKQPEAVWRRYMKRRVIVQTKDEKTHRGILEGDAVDAIVISSAQQLSHRVGEHGPIPVVTPIPGSLIVPIENLSSVQIMPRSDSETWATGDDDG